jgi:PBP1b-binding outer membrane lipoprotein LpoB
MKRLIMVCSLLLLLTGCKKTIENAQDDLVIRAMTDGEWVISSFTVNSNPITPDFSTYKFKYYSNRTVDAIKSGTVEKTGTWDGNTTTMIISANFSAATYPLNQINGSWLITRNGWTYVEATQTVGPDVKTLRLDKQ